MESAVSSETSISTWLHGATLQNTLTLQRITNLTVFPSLRQESFEGLPMFSQTLNLPSSRLISWGEGYGAPSIDGAVAGEGVTGRQVWNKTFHYVSSHLADFQMSLSGAAQNSLSSDLTALTPSHPLVASCLSKQNPERTQKLTHPKHFVPEDGDIYLRNVGTISIPPRCNNPETEFSTNKLDFLTFFGCR